MFLNKKTIFIFLATIGFKLHAQIDSVNYYLNSTLNDSSKIEICYQNISNTCKTIEEKLNRIKVVENYYNKFENKKMQGLVSFLTGNIYFDYSEYAKAVNYLYIALPLAEQTNFYWLQAKVYNYLGIIFSDQGDSKKAVYYFRKTYEISIKLNDSRQQFVSANNIAVDYTELGEYQKSLYFLGKAEQIMKRFNSNNRDRYLISIFGNKLDNYIGIEDRFNAKNQIDSMNRYIENCPKDNESIISLNHFSGSYYIFIKQHKIALTFLEKNINLIDKYDYQELQKLYNSLKICYMATKGYEKAIEAQSKYYQYKDSISNTNKVRESVELEGKYNNLKIENELLISNLKNSNSELKLKRNKVVIILGAIISFILVINLIIFFNLYRSNKRNNILLVEKNTIIEEKQREILASIRYAKRIQDSFLASEKYINSKLKKLMGN